MIPISTLLDAIHSGAYDPYIEVLLDHLTCRKFGIHALPPITPGDRVRIANMKHTATVLNDARGTVLSIQANTVASVLLDFNTNAGPWQDLVTSREPLICYLANLTPLKEIP